MTPNLVEIYPRHAGGRRMRVKVRYLGLARSRLGKREDEVELREGASLSELLGKLTEMYGELLRGLFDMEKESIVDPSFVITVNSVSRTGDTRLKEGDRVALMTLISGG